MANFMGVEFPDCPKVLHLESSILCNARCIFCPTPRLILDKTRPIYMDEKIWKHVLDQVATQRVERMSPFLNGEPFIDPQLLDIVRYCKKVSPLTVISIYTNACAMTKEKANAAIEAGVTYFHFSLGGYSRAVYERTQPCLEYNQSIANVRQFIELVRGYSGVRYAIGMTTTIDNQSELDVFKRFWKSQGAYDVEGNAVTNRDQESFVAGVYDTDRSRQSDKPCMSMLFDHFYVLTNGDVVMCCEDWSGKVVVGNVVEESVKDIWLGSRMNEVRRIHLEGAKKEIKGLCDNCVVVH